MRRMHLVELEDLPWWPKAVRDGSTDWLAFAGNQSEVPYRDFVRLLAEALRRTGDTEIVDLCSGGGGPLPTLQRMLGEHEGLQVTATVTDLYPNAERLKRLEAESGGRITAATEAVDATDVPDSLRGFRLLSNAFHHFAPEQARGILADAVAKKQGIATLEVVERSATGVLGVLFGSVMGTLATPFLRPWRPSRLVLGWLIPLIPFNILFDGIVSCLRAYSVEELRELVEGIPGADSYDWNIQLLPQGPMSTTVLVGVPKA